jgi:hypothetical protein
VKRASSPSIASQESPRTHFLNVDLDVFARSSLERLATACGERVFPLYVGPHGNGFRAGFELETMRRKTADALVVDLVQVVNALPPQARAIWNRAHRRDLNIGIQAGVAPYSYELALRPETLRLASSVNARIVVTVYAAEAHPARTTRRLKPARYVRPARATRKRELKA